MKIIYRTFNYEILIKSSNDNLIKYSASMNILKLRLKIIIIKCEMCIDNNLLLHLKFEYKEFNESVRFLCQRI